MLYEQGSTRRNYAETINGILQRFPYLKSFLAGPWKLLTTWESLWPGKVHPPMPLPLLKALVTTALAWQWIRLAMVLLLGFYGLLRPCEVIALKVKDCLLASETGCQDAIFLRQKQDERSTNAKRSHRRTIRSSLSKEMFQGHEGQIWPFSSAMLRRRLQQTLQAVTELPHLCVPSSLRAGGATFVFREWQEDVPRLQWKGRWLHFKTLAHYIQELGCWNILEQLTPAARSRVQCLSGLSGLTESSCKEIVVEADLPSKVQRLCMLLKQQQHQGIP